MACCGLDHLKLPKIMVSRLRSFSKLYQADLQKRESMKPCDFLSRRSTFFVLGISLWGCSQRRDSDPLPAIGTIQSIHASYDDTEGDPRKQIAFDVPEDDWDTLFAALQPARYDPSPMKWVSLGELEITLKDGRLFHVSLYSVSGGPGAFAAGPNWEQRTYYRGGSTVRLQKTLRIAHDRTSRLQNQKPDTLPRPD